MELQDSATPLSDLSPTIAGLWNRLKSTADGREDLLDSGHKGNTGKQVGPAWANPESAQEQAPFGPEFSAGVSANDYARGSDDELLAAAKAFDHRAFEELSGRYLKSMRKRVYSMVRNPEDTEDVVQDSLLKAYRHLGDFRESCEFSTWITKIATNTALMFLRKRRSRAEAPFYQACETDEAWTMCDIPDPSPSAERTYARQETLEFMMHAVKRLPPPLRSILEQYHAHEKSQQEAADALGITVASAKARLFRARRKLRSRLERQRISFFDACY